MKIEKRGIRITDLPGGVVIETGDGSIQISGIRDGLTLYPAEAREIRDALNVALGDEVEEASSGTWSRIEDVPTDVLSVSDKDGDLWHRDPIDSEGYFGGSPFAYLNKYAPFRRA